MTLLACSGLATNPTAILSTSHKTMRDHLQIRLLQITRVKTTTCHSAVSKLILWRLTTSHPRCSNTEVTTALIWSSWCHPMFWASILISIRSERWLLVHLSTCKLIIISAWLLDQAAYNTSRCYTKASIRSSNSSNKGDTPKGTNHTINNNSSSSTE